MTFVLSERILRPIGALVDATIRVAGGKEIERIEARSGDEVGELAHGFNRMMEEIARKQRELARQVRAQARNRQRLSAILRTIVDGIIVTDSRTRIVLMNPAASKLLGLPQVEPGDDKPLAVLGDSRLVPLIEKTLAGESIVGGECDIDFEGEGRQGKRTVAVRTAPITSDP